MSGPPRVACFPGSLEVNGVVRTGQHLVSFSRERALPFLCVHAGLASGSCIGVPGGTLQPPDREAGVMALHQRHTAAAPGAEPARISVVVCAYNEERYLKACLHSVLAQSRQPDEVLVVNNASTDGTRRIAERIEGVEVIDEWRRGLVRAREAGRRHATGDLLVYLDADSRLPLTWIESVARKFDREPKLVGLSGRYRFYDWDRLGRLLLGLYDVTLAPLTHLLVHQVLGIGAVFYGGAFCVRREALDAIGGFDTTIEFHGEDTNLGRRLTAVGDISLSWRCHTWTSARRYQVMGKRAVFGLYIRNFVSEVLRHRPSDTRHVDVRV